MFFLSRQTVRRHRSLYAGSFVALAVGVFLLGLAATATAATVAYDGPAAASITVDLPQADPPQQVRVPLSDADVSGLQTVIRPFAATVSKLRPTDSLTDAVSSQKRWPNGAATPCDGQKSVVASGRIPHAQSICACASNCVP